MKKLSSSLLLLLTVVFVVFSASSARANRAAAGEIAYKWVSDSTYLLTYTFYKDCGGATAEPNTVNLCYYNTCNPDKGSVTLIKKAGANGVAVPNACSGAASTTCSTPAGLLRGYRKWEYEGTVTLPSRCASWRFLVSIGFRNGAITNYTVPGAANNLYTEATLNNIDAPTSSSPTFAEPAIQYMCAGAKQHFDYAGVDADGDVLSYTLIDPSSAADNQVICFIPPTPTSYVFGGASAGTSLTNNPFLTGNTFNLDPATGLMSFIPTAAIAQTPQLALLVTKRRGTKVVGTVVRDMQFVISTGCAASVTNFAVNPITSSNILLSPITGKEWQVCPNVSHTIKFSITTSAGSTINNVTDNHLTFSPSSGTSTTLPYVGLGSPNVTGSFTWTPKEIDEGIKYLVIKSKVCTPGNPIVTRVDSIPIDIIRTAKIVAKDTMICLGESTTICGLPFGAFSWSTTLSGSGVATGSLGITGISDSCTLVTPGFTTYYLLETTGIPAICKRTDFPALNTNQAQIKIIVANPRIDVGPDTTMCSYDTLQMNANLINPQPELTYRWRWTPGNYLNDSTIVNPVMKIPYGTPTSSVPDSITFYLKCTPYPDTACFKLDTVVVHILKGFYVLTGDSLGSTTGLGYMGRQKGVSDTTICQGKSISILGWGDQRYSYTWTPSTGVSTPTGFVPGPGLKITPTATTTYSITASHLGCRDSTKKINITVEPIPVVNIGPDKSICFGDTINLESTITPDPSVFTTYKYNWAPGGALSRADTTFCFFTGYLSQTIRMTVTTPAGCSGYDEATYTVAPRKYLTPGPDVNICPGDSVQISVTGDAMLKTVTWKPYTNIDSIHSLTPIVAPNFTTDYIVVGLDSNQCIDSTSVKVTVLPRAMIYLPDSATIYPGDVYQMDPQGNCLYYTWFPPVGLDYPLTANPKAQPALNTTYFVEGITDAGCIAEDSIYVIVAPDSYIDVPNAFTPGRGENSIFKPTHLGKATLKSFTVYDRWGVKLYETSDLTQGWDGTYGGKPQPYGVYVYVVEAVTAAGRVVAKQGSVTLIR